jgi:hypothetical protein
MEKAIRIPLIRGLLILSQSFHGIPGHANPMLEAKPKIGLRLSVIPYRRPSIAFCSELDISADATPEFQTTSKSMAGFRTSPLNGQLVTFHGTGLVMGRPESAFKTTTISKLGRWPPVLSRQFETCRRSIQIN